MWVPTTKNVSTGFLQMILRLMQSPTDIDPRVSQNQNHPRL